MDRKKSPLCSHPAILGQSVAIGLALGFALDNLALGLALALMAYGLVRLACRRRGASQ